MVGFDDDGNRKYETKSIGEGFLACYMNKTLVSNGIINNELVTTYGISVYERPLEDGCRNGQGQNNPPIIIITTEIPLEHCLCFPDKCNEQWIPSRRLLGGGEKKRK